MKVNAVCISIFQLNGYFLKYFLTLRVYVQALLSHLSVGQFMLSSVIYSLVFQNYPVQLIFI